jgi:hypothetical protein
MKTSSALGGKFFNIRRDMLSSPEAEERREAMANINSEMEKGFKKI